MTSLIERLRGQGDPRNWESNNSVALCDEAAYALEAQQKRIADLKRVLVIAERYLALVAETGKATSACKEAAELCSAVLAGKEET